MEGLGDDMTSEQTLDSTELDVVIVGGGVSGLYALYHLRGLGYRVRVYEQGGDAGGTWYWNRYPGCRCDIESLEYSFSFDEKLEQEWQWPERYGTQPEILRYLNHVVGRHNLRKDIVFNCPITSATFNEDANQWVLLTGGGQRITSRFCIMATGNLSTPRVPDYEGLDAFQGKIGRAHV